MWRSHLHKSADLILEIPARMEFWPADMHEPILIGFFFPAFQYQPWFFMGTPLMVQIQRDVRQAIEDGNDIRRILKSVLFTSSSIKRMTEDEVADSLSNPRPFVF